VTIALTSATTSSLIAAAAVLAGVLIGGLITAGTTAYFERRRERGDVRQARRLVVEELRSIWNQAEGLVQRGRYPKTFGPPTFLPTEQWEANRALLARHLDDEIWDSLSPFMDSMPAARAVAARESPDSEVSEDRLEGFAETRDLAAEHFEALSGESVDTIETPRRRRFSWTPWRRT
jgi:hypothetical protein